MSNSATYCDLTLPIGNMTCAACATRIENGLKEQPGVKKVSVSYAAGSASVTYNPNSTTRAKIVVAIENLGYDVLPDSGRAAFNASRAMGLALIIVVLFGALQHFGILNLLVPSQLADTNMEYGMLFVVGLLTSVHCVAMCGGINLSQNVALRAQSTARGGLSTFKPTLLYNLGRVLSYTAIGFIVGGLGSIVVFSGELQGALKLIAGGLMVIMGMNMLGIFPVLSWITPRMPHALTQLIGNERFRGKGPLFIGLLNGLMPCGPLQAMQLYALSTASPFAGALAMLFFSLGTVPLMFGLGALASALGKVFTRKVMTVGAVLVVVLGMSMFSQGWNLSGLAVPGSPFAGAGFEQQAGAEEQSGSAGQTQVTDGVQQVNSTLAPGSYPSITVQAGMPVKWAIDAPQGSINGCNNRMILREYGIEHAFATGENIIEFTPTSPGTFQYSCWMGMIRGTIYVV